MKSNDEKIKALCKGIRQLTNELDIEELKKVAAIMEKELS